VGHPRPSPGASPAVRRGEPVTTIDPSPPARVPDGEPRSQSLTLSPLMMTVGRFGALAPGLATAPARALGPQGQGVTAISLSILTIMSIVMALGVPVAVRRRISAVMVATETSSRQPRPRGTRTSVPMTLTRRLGAVI
jgi:hypothetical protein